MDEQTPIPQDNNPVITDNSKLPADIAPDQVPPQKWDELIRQGEPKLQQVGSQVITPAGTEINNTYITDGGGGTPGGSDTQVQFNDGGAFGGDAQLTYNKTTDTLGVGAASDTFFIQGTSGGTTSNGASISLLAGNGGSAEGDGGEIAITAGNAPVDGNGGLIDIYAGDGGTAGGSGGGMTLYGGTGKGGQAGGDINIQAGGATSGSGGDGGYVYLVPGSGDGSGQFVGNVEVQFPPGTNSADPGKFVISGGSGGYSIRLVGDIHTTDATPTSYKIVTLASNNDSAMFYVKVHARRTGGTGGSAGDSAGYIRVATYKRAGAAAPALVGSVTDLYTAEDQAGWDVGLVVSTNDIKVQVTGAANNNITWSFEATVVADNNLN